MSNKDYYYYRTEEYDSQSTSDKKEQIDFDRIMLERNKSRAWSVASLTLSICSILCCCISIASIALGVFAIICAVISRKNLGYFDGLSIAGLIVGIFGVIFGATSIVASLVLDFDAMFEEILTEMETDL